jgi:hypothetical protein
MLFVVGPLSIFLIPFSIAMEQKVWHFSTKVSFRIHKEHLIYFHLNITWRSITLQLFCWIRV